MFEVVYLSRGGNTRKVAEAIADELGTAARDIKTVGTLPQDAFIFLGSGCYGAVLAKEIADFIERNQLQGRKIALFTTSAFGWGKEVLVMENHLLNQGANVVGRFSCFGECLAINIGHPDAEDLEKAREFARSMALREYPQMAEIQTIAAMVGAVS